MERQYLTDKDYLTYTTAKYRLSTGQKKVFSEVFSKEDIAVKEVAQKLGKKESAIQKSLGEIYKKFGIDGVGGGKCERLRDFLESEYRTSYLENNKKNTNGPKNTKKLKELLEETNSLLIRVREKQERGKVGEITSKENLNEWLSNLINQVAISDDEEDAHKIITELGENFPKIISTLAADSSANEKDILIVIINTLISIYDINISGCDSGFLKEEESQKKKINPHNES